MTDDAINRVHKLADNENCGFEFWDWHGDPADTTGVDKDDHVIPDLELAGVDYHTDDDSDDESDDESDDDDDGDNNDNNKVKTTAVE